MKFWDFEKRPYRPVAKVLTGEDGKQYEQQPDAFMDAMHRIWYAATVELIERLPADPLREPKIPPEFWHPDYATRSSNAQHYGQKRAQEDKRAEDGWAA